MSRIGKKRIDVPPTVKVVTDGALLKISGPGDTLSLNIRPEVRVEYNPQTRQIQVVRQGDSRLCRALHGTTRALIANMVLGVTEGFRKDLKIFGTGYGVKIQADKLLVSAGFAKPVVLSIPAGIKLDIKTPNTRGNEIPAEFGVVGADKDLVGRFAAAVRNVRPPEPYQGKGIRYADEHVKRKEGKAFASGA